MEDLFSVVVVIIGIVVSVISANNKNKQKQARKMPYASTIASAPAPQPVAAPRTERVSMSEMLPVREEPLQPNVHTHLEPDCETHDAAGSTGYISPEGKDPCHEEQLTHPRTTDSAENASAAMSFDWSGDAMVKAFVMQEVLTRPSQRRAR